MKACKSYLVTGAGTLAYHGYASNATEAKNNETLDTIRDGFYALRISNNATVQCNNDIMAELRVVIATMQQQLAMLSISITAPSPHGCYIPPTVAIT